MSNKNLFFIYFIFFVGGILSLVYYDELFVQKEIRSINKMVARVVKTQKNVKFRSKNELRWYQVDKDDFFIDGDKIFTGDESKLTIETVHSNQINLDSNSLIKLRGGLVSLNRGEITAFINKQMIFYINGKKAVIRSSQKSILNIQKIEGQGDILTVTDGKVEVDFNGRKIFLSKNQKSQIDSQNILKRTGLKKIFLKTPLSKDSYYCGDTVLELQWDSSVLVNSYILKFYSNPMMTKLVRVLKQKENKYSLPAKTFKKDIYLSILGVKNNVAISQLELTKIIFIAKKLLPKIKTTKKTFIKGTPIELTNERKINQLFRVPYFYFNVKNKVNQSVYRALQLPVDSVFLDTGINIASLCFDHIKCGEKPLCNNTEFTLRNSSKPEIIIPRMGQKVYSTKKKTKIDFIWTVPRTADYRNIEIQILSGGKIILSHYVENYKKGENITSIFLDVGNYSWRINGQEGDQSLKTITHSFHIISVVPPRNLIATFGKFNKKSMDYLFKWEHEKISDDNLYLEYSINNIIKSELLTNTNKKDKSRSMKLPITDHFKWRIKSRKKNNELYVTRWKEVLTPTCENTNGIKLKRIKYSSKRPVIFKWRKVKGAHSYLLKIFQFNETSKEVSFSYKVYVNSFKWENAFAKDLSWTVTPVDITGRKCTTSELGKYEK